MNLFEKNQIAVRKINGLNTDTNKMNFELRNMVKIFPGDENRNPMNQHSNSTCSNVFHVCFITVS